MQWSKYQEAIFDFNLNRPEHKFVVATAGSGKTTVIEECIRQLSRDKKVLAVAFGRDIKATLEKRLGKLRNVEIRTLNGFGNSCFPRGWKKLEKEKTFDVLYFDVLEKPKDRSFYYGIRHKIQKIVGLLKANMIWKPTYVDVLELMEQHSIVLGKKVSEKDFMEALLKTYELGWTKTKVIDYDDQIAMPLYFDWEIPYYDDVFCDEAQDLTPAQAELVARIKAARYTFVGDRRQAIYMFRGADIYSVDNIIKHYECTELPLSVCYRCSKAVVRRAQSIAPEIEFHADAPEGLDCEITPADFIKTVGPRDFVLCRTTAPLVSECLRAIREGKKAGIRGREIGSFLLDFIDSIPYNGDESGLLLEAAVSYVAEKSESAQRGGRADAVVLLADQLDTLRVLVEASPTVDGVRSRIEELFSDTVEGITFMTIHKAKGLETENVFILRPDLIPHKLATTYEQLVVEDNLLFVAITRAKLNLYWVTNERVDCGSGEPVCPD